LQKKPAKITPLKPIPPEAPEALEERPRLIPFSVKHVAPITPVGHYLELADVVVKPKAAKKID
jgi:hypothetical protein